MVAYRRPAAACLLAATASLALSTALHPWPVPGAAATAASVATSPTWLASHTLLFGWATMGMAGVVLLHLALRRRAPRHRDAGPAAAGAVLAAAGFAVLAAIAVAEGGPFRDLAALADDSPAALGLFAATYDNTLRAFDAAAAAVGLGLAVQAWVLAAGAVVRPALARAGAGLAGLGAVVCAASAVAPAPLPIWLGAVGVALVTLWVLVLGLALGAQGLRGELPRRPALPLG